MAEITGGSLAKAAEIFAKTLPEEDHARVQRRNPWKTLFIVCLDPALRRKFLPQLSISQIRSLRLILEWKGYKHDGPDSYTGPLSHKTSYEGDDNAAQDDMDSAAASSSIDHDSLSGLDDSDDGSQTSGQTENSDLGSNDSGDTFYGSYPECLQELYEHERDPDSLPTNLGVVRQFASEWAAVQRICTSYLRSSNIPGLGFPQVNQRYLDLSHDIRVEADDRELTAVIEPCPWLGPEAVKGLPYYLWDVEKCRTVRARDIAEQPKYIVISHTWGRWKLPGAGVDMKPQVPWLVPENSRFSVQQLPAMLQNLGKKFSIPYVWFDLLCIPQDGSQLAGTEIARQAAIFKNATVAIAWLNGTGSWSVVQNSLLWAALSILRTTYIDGGRKLERVGAFLDELRMDTNEVSYDDQAALTVESLECAEGLPDVLDTSWFTSLWTLQEASLRPDILLFNKDWDMLSIGHDLPLTLDLTITLTSMAQTHSKGPEGAPILQFLTTVFWRANMHFSQRSHPVYILDCGCARYCKRSRSEAVMSILGATDWHNGARETGSHNSENTLLLGQYTFAFIREVRHKYGFIFFRSTIETNPFTEPQDIVGPMGTILPFSEPRRNKLPARGLFPSPLTLEREEGHPSVGSWDLLPDGSVKITEAGILWSSPAKDGDDDSSGNSAANYHRKDTCDSGDISVEISLPHNNNNGDVFKDISGASTHTTTLRSWMTTTCTDSPKYAVVVSSGKDDGVLYGFILKVLPVEIAGGATVVGRFADFNTGEGCRVAVPETSAVDWIAY